MKIVIAGGGTGGHLFPALAVAKKIEKMFADARVTFVGTARGIEARIVPKEGYDLRFIRSEGLVGKSVYRTVRSLLKISLSLHDAYKILKNIRPDVVLGVGGYSSGPVLLCARLMGIPTIIHEQNTVPGLANKILGKFVDRIAVTYYESMKYFPADSAVVTGNPVREEIFSGDRDRGYERFSLEEGVFTVFVFGGSLGASRINEAVGTALESLEDLKENIQFLHQTGNRDLDKVKNIYAEKQFKGTVVPFAYEMADAYAVADLVISRAGATTIAELMACGKPAILVPYPHAAANHQEVNAKRLWDMGAAMVVLEKDLTGEGLAEMIRDMTEDPDSLREMGQISKSLSCREATEKVIELIRGLLKKDGIRKTEHKDDLKGLVI